MNIAITGKMAAGKTTISDRLIRDHGYTRVSFAGHLKDIAAQVYGGGREVSKGATYFVTDQHTGREQEVTGREILQRLGQVVKQLDQSFWIRWLLSDLASREGGPYVLDDLRFPFEASALKSEGWVVVKVDAPADVRRERYKRLYGAYPTEAMETHPSETGVDSVEHDLVVDGTGDVCQSVCDILCVAQEWHGR